MGSPWAPPSFSGKLSYDGWEFDATDLLIIAMAKDGVLAPEFFWSDPNNHEYGGCYRVRDYQVEFNRVDGKYEGFACARSVGKTERQKIRAFIHFFRRVKENLLITAPELLHLLPLTDAIEGWIEGTRATRECLHRDKLNKTGFSHQPFGVRFRDGTRIIGRIPQRDGRGVKGQHQPDLMIEEAQDYPEAGWTEIQERLALDELVLTPDGWKKMADIHVGDFVVGSNGMPTEVIAESDIQERTVMTVVLSDGTEIQCDEGHLWTVRCNRDVEDNKWRTLRTDQIEDALKKGYGFGSERMPFFLPRIERPVHFNEVAELPIDPYWLGLLIGDGGMSKSQLMFSSADDELIESIRAIIHPEEVIVHRSNYDYSINHATRKKGSPPTKERLEELGMMGCRSWEKFIPEQYLFSSEKDRLSLLQGLMDSDGHINNHGLSIFGTTSQVLANNVWDLVLSLGGRASRKSYANKRGFRTMHVISFRLGAGLDTCRLERKLSRAKESSRDCQRRKIIAVRRGVETKPMKCIAVSAKDGLFVTRGFALTHNTVLKERDDFTFHFYGVHRGQRGGGFSRNTTQGHFKVHCLTALMRKDWNAENKAAAIATYGGTNSPDYRRNILGEPGAASSPLFVSSRLMACVDQDRESEYNVQGYRKQNIRWEDFESGGLSLEDIIDLPSGNFSKVVAGMDIGLTNSPTVMSIFAEIEHKKKRRLALIRRINLERFSSPYIRKLIRIVYDWCPDIDGIGIDITGLGFPIFQELTDGETKPPPGLLRAARGWKFNEKIPVGLEAEKIVNKKDAFGRPVNDDNEVMMTVIEVTARYLREWVDTGYLLLPFDPEVTNDLLAENMQRVQSTAALTGSKKPNAFHILDSFRMAALIDKMDANQQQHRSRSAVLEQAIDVGGGAALQQLQQWGYSGGL